MKQLFPKTPKLLCFPVFRLHGVIALFLIISCNGVKMEEKTTLLPSIKNVPASAWQKLAQKKIYFGHQSVGYNIMDGIKDLMKENPEIKLNIVETSDPGGFNGGILAHSRVGKNVDPKSKVDEFVKFISNGIGNKADAAALKFCYVDVTAKTSVENVFSGYSDSIIQLKKKYPEMTIIHFTVPLRESKTTWKTWIKRLKKLSVKRIFGSIMTI